MTTNFTYDADGEQTSSTQSGITTSSATWNGAGQLTAFSDAAASMTAASYDGDGLRATSTTSAGTQDYVWNPVSQIPLLIMDSANVYVYAGGLAPAEQVSLSSGSVTYLIADSLSSLRGTVSSTGALTGTTDYDAWGLPETTGGLTATTPFGFAGGYTDSSGLIYLLARYYSPEIGQFISIDPEVSQTIQPYEYASGNPVTYSDPTGQVHARVHRFLGVPVGIDIFFNRVQTKWIADHLDGTANVIRIAINVACLILPGVDSLICDGAADIADLYAHYISDEAQYIVHHKPTRHWSCLKITVDADLGVTASPYREGRDIDGKNIPVSWCRPGKGGY